MNIEILYAKENESDILTSIAFAAKRYWNYPEEYFDVWKEELTITPAYINRNQVYVAKIDEKAIGFVSLVEVKDDFRVGELLITKGYWLDHIFMHPDFIGKSVGSDLISFVMEWCGKENISYLHILSDPNAKGFYDKVGAEYIKEVPSNISGRTVSLYKLDI